MTSTQQYVAALDRVLELAVLVNDDMTRTLARDGLTTARAHLLWELHQHGPTTQRELADALRVSPRNVTGLVDALVSTGFVTRQPHPHDRRATLVAFTDRGAATATALADGQREFAELLFAEMSPERFAGFVTGLDEVLGRLRQAIDAEDPAVGRA
jgi:DNA-binding MarR family transcriptional regulator